LAEAPALAELLGAAVPFALPLRRRFRGLDVREGVLLRGPEGWGEFAPFDDYSDDAAARWLACAVEAAYGSWPDPVRTVVPVNAIIPAVDSADAAFLAREAVLERGCRTMKVKVGSRDLADDEARVAAIRDVLDTVLGPGLGRIRIDANAAWDLGSAATALRRLSAYGLEYVEQPCRDDDDLRALRRQVDVPFAADESIRLAADPGAVRVSDFADVAVLKVAPLGGVRATLRLAARLDVPVVVSGSLDSSVGLGAGLAAAAALPELPYDCGLGTGALLAADLTDPLLPVDGGLAVRRPRPELGLLLESRDRLSAERAQWWRERLASAWTALADMKG
jgi:O-succinylbenzoate synthase